MVEVGGSGASNGRPGGASTNCNPIPGPAPQTSQTNAAPCANALARWPRLSLSKSRPDVISRAHVARVPRVRAPRNPCVAPRKRLRACEEGSIHAEPRLALESLFAREETRVSLNKLAWRPECSRL